MFLKRFKKKSIQKYINNILKNRNANVNDGKIESVGIILNSSTVQSFLADTELGLSEYEVKSCNNC